MLGSNLGGRFNVKALRGRFFLILSLTTQLHKFFVLQTAVTTAVQADITSSVFPGKPKARFDRLPEPRRAWLSVVYFSR